jgi:hypothetical protein
LGPWEFQFINNMPKTDAEKRSQRGETHQQAAAKLENIIGYQVSKQFYWIKGKQSPGVDSSDVRELGQLFGRRSSKQQWKTNLLNGKWRSRGFLVERK